MISYRPKFIFITFLLFCIPILLCYSQNSQTGDSEIIDEADELDSLFDAPANDIVINEDELPDVDHREAFEKSETVTVKGNFSTTGIAAIGWAGWDFVTDISQGFDPSAGLTSKASISFDARPSPVFHVFGSVSTAFNPLDGGEEAENTEDELSDFYSSILGAAMTQSWNGLSIDSLYCDYILNDFLYTRIGKHSFNWGQARLFKVGNLMSDSGSTYNIRFSMPTLFGLNLVVLTNRATTIKRAVFAGKADFVLGDVMLSPAVRFNYDEGFNALLSYKQVVAGIDILLDVTAEFGHDFVSTKAVAGFFKEWTDLLIYGEYMAALYSDGRLTHNCGLAIGLDNPLDAPFDLGAQWTHNFMDLSGTVTLGLSQTILPFVNMKIGLPIIYGSRQSSAVLNNSDPSNRSIALVLAIQLKGGF